MDDSVFSSQFQAMRDAFAREGIAIEVAYTPSGRADYMYETNRLLARAEVVGRVLEVLPGAMPVDRDEQPDAESLRVLSTEQLRDGYLTVPQALDLLDERLKVENPALDGGFPLVTPVHILHVTQHSPDTVRACAPTEPEVPAGGTSGGNGTPPAGAPAERAYRTPDRLSPPYPPAALDGGAGVVIGVCDTGLLAEIASAPWLAGVTGETDPLGRQLPGGLHDIPKYCGHGTFAAGVARCEAPESTVYVGRHFPMGGAEREWMVVQKLQEMIASDPAPQVINLSAGSYTRNDWLMLSFSALDHGGITLTASAGNEATQRKFYPAAFDWAVAVGALGADQRNRAWFSNYGDWVDVYTLGEGMVNAFATGEYTYQEPPKRPARQIFDGRARWCGTSFSAPLVAGLIAARMASTGTSSAVAAYELLEEARKQAIPGVGPALFPRQP
jgi:Subtilase family